MIDSKQPLELLRRVEVFSHLPDPTLQFLHQYSETNHYPANTLLFQKGDPATCLYVLRKGSVSIQEDPALDKEIARFVEGDSFGELDMVTGSPRTASAKALTDVSILRFPREGVSLAQLLSADPSHGAQILLSFLVMIAGRIRKAHSLIKENSPWIQEMRRQVYGDNLTGLYNRRFLEEQLPELLKNPNRPVSVLMVKPDNFKLINDTYGHEAGDQALARMAKALLSVSGPRWIIVRYMGNELCCVLPDTDSRAAKEAALSIQKAYRELDISELTGGKPFQISVSVGIAVYPLHATDPETLIKKAHQLPLIGRERGGNKILFPTLGEEP